MTDQKSLTFEEWVDYCFDHPVTNPEWHWELDADSGHDAHWYFPDPAAIAEFLAALYESSGSLTGRYSNAQIGQGLWFLNGVGSEYSHCALDACVPNEIQIRWINSIYTLYADLLARECSEHLSHLDEPGAAPINVATYMLWDMDTIEHATDSVTPHLIDPVFSVLERALAIDHIAVQESALHGLGHQQMDHPNRVVQIVNRFIKNNASARPELLEYATDAMEGCVQ